MIRGVLLGRDRCRLIVWSRRIEIQGLESYENDAEGGERGVLQMGMVEG